MQSTVVIAAQELVQVDLEEAIPWNYPPAPEIWLCVTSDDEIGDASSGYFLPPSHSERPPRRKADSIR